ncbi:carboxypeptidase-like regulatory domain-containing protein [Pareuzebyella sediminis]|uniref:carboxypeptidase-like regulatory domain-containing protein n=1 Tax=Pareuzebyella sediminis TaxID=2607998 RepID=UPI0011F006B2|nr:carboxypeptidase-like regulatory domain-containing protein [Pareuzebyella sediminis]
MGLRARTTTFILFIFLGCWHANSQESDTLISGTVLADRRPLENANVVLKGTNQGVKTNYKGEFSIAAGKNDTLLVSYIGMRTTEMVVDGDAPLEIILLPKIEQLDEVRVKGKKRSRRKTLLADYPTDKSLIKTSRGILDQDQSSSFFRVVDGEDLVVIGDILTAIKVHFPNMVVDRTTNPMDPTVYFPSLSDTERAVIFDVDGFIYEKAPTYLDISMIDRIAVLRRNAAFSRYGPQGAGGVIVINTKHQTRIDEAGIDRRYDNMGLIDSIYGQLNANGLATVLPPYMIKITNAATQKEALKTFESQKQYYGDSVNYYLDMADYFRKKWNNTKKAQKILEDTEHIFGRQAQSLRALAYTYDQQGEWDNALRIYLKILKLESKAAQSFFDVAETYARLGNYRKSLAVYARYEYAIRNLDSIPFEELGADYLMTTESINIIRLKGKELSITTDADALTDVRNTRLVFEWNTEQAGFELQLQGPNEDYYSWENTLDTTDTLLLAQREKGYLSKQFFLKDEERGPWKLYVTHLEKSKNIPVYLKVTSYFDFGTPRQTSKINVFQLAPKQIPRFLLTIDTSEKTTLY